MDAEPMTNNHADTHAVWTEQRIRALGAITDLPTAAKILGFGRALAYELARNGTFPVPLIRAGTRYRVPTAPILAVLHLSSDDDLTARAERSVDHDQAPVRRTGTQHHPSSTSGET